MKNDSVYFGYEKLKFVADNLLNILFTKAEEISIPSILEKICVSPPYFAFKKIYRYENILMTCVNAEQSMNDEIGCMSMGEMCRHTAILGTCSVAFEQNEKYYYLAKEGKAKIVNIDAMKQNASQELYILMCCDGSDRRSAISYGIAINSTLQIILDVVVTYEKIADKLFRKFFLNIFK